MQDSCAVKFDTAVLIIHMVQNAMAPVHCGLRNDRLKWLVWCYYFAREARLE